MSPRRRAAAGAPAGDHELAEQVPLQSGAVGAPSHCAITPALRTSPHLLLHTLTPSAVHTLSSQVAIDDRDLLREMGGAGLQVWTGACEHRGVDRGV